MRIPNSLNRSPIQFDMTPLIDVVFQLIIFFLVASYFVRNEKELPVTLPLAEQGRDDEPSERRIVVSIDAAGELTMAGLSVTPAIVSTQLKQAAASFGAKAVEFRIRGDEQVPYSAIEPLLIEASQAGITHLRIVVRRR